MYIPKEVSNEIKSNGYDAAYQKFVINNGEPSEGLSSDGRRIFEYALANQMDFDYQYVAYSYTWHISGYNLCKKKLSKAVSDITQKGHKLSFQCLMDQGCISVLVDALNKNDCINDSNTYCRTSLFSFFCEMIENNDKEYVISKLRAIKKKKHKRLVGFVVFSGIASKKHINKYASVITKPFIDDFVGLVKEWELLTEFWDRFFKKTGINVVSHIASEMIDYLPESRKVQDIATDVLSASIEDLIGMVEKGVITAEIAAQDMLLKCVNKHYWDMSFTGESYKYIEFCLKHNIFMPYSVIRLFLNPEKNYDFEHYQQIFDRVGSELYEKWVLEDLNAPSLELAVKEYGEAIISQELDGGVYFRARFKPLDTLLDNLTALDLTGLYESSSQASIVGAKRTNDPMKFSSFVKTPRSRTLLSKMILST